ncbi:hypothetical protein [Deinococcus sp. RM]|nr:hypothetical protein [Deinococcus sp. RM]
MFKGDLPAQVTSLLVMTAGSSPLNTNLRVLVTRPRRDGGTD